jgi:hypothetical protein
MHYEDFEDLKAMEFLDFIGKDYKDRLIVLFTAANFKPQLVDAKRLQMFLLKQLDELRYRPFVLIYAYSAVKDENNPGDTLLQDIFDVFNVRFSDNLQQLYILHPTYFFRMYMYMILPFNNTP